MDERSTPDRTDARTTRRTLLAAAALAGAGSIAGCLGPGEDVPNPITIEEGHDCDQCTMDIRMHPGPVGQTYYEEPEAVVGEDRPARFCSVLCLYSFYYEQAGQGHEAEVHYATDYSTVEYEVSGDEGALVVDAHFDADEFERVEELTMVVDSDVEGAMGASLIGFTDPDEADAFQEEYGGEQYTHDDVSEELIMSLM